MDQICVEITGAGGSLLGGNQHARDLFDLSLVIEREPESLRTAGRFLVRHREAFIEQLSTRTAVLKAQYDAIDALKYRPTFEDAAVRAKRFLKGLAPDRGRA